jgi:hypothetical protein
MDQHRQGQADRRRTDQERCLNAIVALAAAAVVLRRRDA